MELPDARPIAIAMFAGIPLVHLQQVPLSLLERDLRYDVIGVIEITGQILYLVTGIAVALSGGGAWSLVIAWYGQQAVLLIGFWSRAGYRPRLIWGTDEVIQLLQFGLAATAASAAYATRNLVSPLLVAPLLGPAAVGYLSLAARLVDQIGFVRQVITRMSFAVVGRLSGHPQRLRGAVREAMEAQVLAGRYTSRAGKPARTDCRPVGLRNSVAANLDTDSAARPGGTGGCHVLGAPSGSRRSSSPMGSVDRECDQCVCLLARGRCARAQPWHHGLRLGGCQYLAVLGSRRCPLRAETPGTCIRLHPDVGRWLGAGNGGASDVTVACLASGHLDPQSSLRTPRS